jgi:hypothetical protein
MVSCSLEIRLGEVYNSSVPELTDSLDCIEGSIDVIEEEQHALQRQYRFDQWSEVDEIGLEGSVGGSEARQYVVGQ